MRIAELVTQFEERDPPSNAVVFSVSERLGIVPQDQLFTKKIALDNRTAYLRIEWGDVVYNPYLLWNRAAGVCFDKRGGCVSPVYVVLRPRVRGIERFLHYFFRSRIFSVAVDAIASGSVTRRRTAPVQDILDLEFSLPSLLELKAINLLLTTLDSKIELKQQMNETLEAITRAIFKSWFVDFETFRSQGMKDSALGKIPNGWTVTELGAIAEIIDCLHSKKPIRQPNGKPLLQLWNILDNGLIDMTDTYHIHSSDYDLWTSRIEASKGDCVITNVGRVAATAQIPEGLRCALGRNMTAIRCTKSFTYPTFLIECLRSTPMKEEITAKVDTGTILEALNVRNIPILRLVLPPLHEVERFEFKCRPLRAKMEMNLAQNITLAAVRDALLPKLSSGEVRVFKG